MYANFLSSNLRSILPSSTEPPSLSSVMARVEREGVGSRKLSVAETLKQATAALETHRAWMKRRVSTSIAPLDRDAGNGRESPIVGEAIPKTTINVGWALGSEKEVKQRGDNEIEGAGPPTIARGVTRVPAPPLSIRARQQGDPGHESESSTYNSPPPQANQDLLESPNTPFPEYGQDSPDTGTPVDHLEATAPNKLHFTFPSSSQTKRSNFKIKKRQRMGKSSVVPMGESLTEVDEELSEDIPLSSRAKSPEVFIGESFQSKISPIPPASTLAAWGSLSSLDNYIESLEATNKDVNQKSTHSKGAQLASSTPLRSLANSAKEENHDTKPDGLGSVALSSPQQLVASPDLVQSSTIDLSAHSMEPPTKAEDFSADCSMPSPSKDESGESSFESSSNAEQFEALKAASSAKLIPVSQAPRAQRSSFSLHKQSKLGAAEANTKIYEAHFKNLSNPQADDQVSGYGDSFSQLSLRNSSSMNIPDSVLQAVLPKQGGRARKSGLAILHVTKDSEHATQHVGKQSTPAEEDKNQKVPPTDSQPTLSQTSLKASLQTSVAPLEEQSKQQSHDNKASLLTRSTSFPAKETGASSLMKDDDTSLKGDEPYHGNKASLLTRSKSFPAKEAGASSLKDYDTSLKGDELQIEEVTTTSETPGGLFPNHSTPRFKSHALEVLNLPPLKTMIGEGIYYTARTFKIMFEDKRPYDVSKFFLQMKMKL